MRSVSNDREHPVSDNPQAFRTATQPRTSMPCEQSQHCLSRCFLCHSLLVHCHTHTRRDIKPENLLLLKPKRATYLAQGGDPDNTGADSDDDDDVRHTHTHTCTHTKHVRTCSCALDGELLGLNCTSRSTTVGGWGDAIAPATKAVANRVNAQSYPSAAMFCHPMHLSAQAQKNKLPWLTKEEEGLIDEQEWADIPDGLRLKVGGHCRAVEMCVGIRHSSLT